MFRKDRLRGFELDQDLFFNKKIGIELPNDLRSKMDVNALLRFDVEASIDQCDD